MNSRAAECQPESGSRILLLASRALRRGPDSPLLRFVRDFEFYFRHVLKPEFYVLGGSYRAIRRAGLLRDYDCLRPVAAGREGGLVTLADILVRSAGEPDTDITVVYLLDPADPASTYPDSNALKRECVVTGTPFLATYAAAAEWFGLQWAQQALACGPDATTSRWLLSTAEQESLGVEGRTPARQGIALIAHDALKQQMLEFAAEHFDFLKSYRRRYATGTTGSLLNGVVPQRLVDQWRDEAAEADAFAAVGKLPPHRKKRIEANRALERCAHAMHERLNHEDWVICQPSGPRGGDIRVAEMVRRGECDVVAFFEDPHVSREHEADIQLLERATRIPSQSAICLHDPATIRRWAENWERCAAGGLAPLMPLAQALRLAFSIEWVPVPVTEKDIAGGTSAPDARAVGHSAAWYLNALLIHKYELGDNPKPTLHGLIGGGALVAEAAMAMGLCVSSSEPTSQPSPLSVTPLWNEPLERPGPGMSAVQCATLFASPYGGCVRTGSIETEDSAFDFALLSTRGKPLAAADLDAVKRRLKPSGKIILMVGEQAADIEQAAIVLRAHACHALVADIAVARSLFGAAGGHSALGR